MQRGVFIRAVAVSVGFAALIATAQEPRLDARTNPARSQVVGLKKQAPGGTNAVATAKPSVKTPAPSRAEQTGVPGPGVYVTRPFACIVVVPGGDLDRGCLVPAPGNGHLNVKKPYLEFIPRTQNPMKPETSR